MIRFPLFLMLMLFGWVTMIRIYPAYPEPYLPVDDAQILEQLSFKGADRVSRELATLRTKVRQNPRHLESAVKLAARYIEQGRSEGDPRDRKSVV